MALASAATLAGCFNPEDPGAQPATGGSGGATLSETTAIPSTSLTSTSPVTTATSVDSTGTSAGPTSPTQPGTTTESTTDDTTGTSTGEVSDCPGGQPTPGEAPYMLSTVLAADDTDDVDVGDINGDGHLDLISLARVAGSVETFFGDGRGNFASAGVTLFNTAKFAGYPDTVRLGAIADDTVDLFVHMEGPVQLWVIRGDGAGGWPSPQVYDGTYVRGIDMADLNGDDVLDLAYVGASNLEVRLGIGLTETYADPVMYVPNNYGSVVRIADITGDGVLDLLTADWGSSELQVYAGDGGGNFERQLPLVTGSTSTGVDAGHFDSDGLVDLALTTADDLRVFYGVADGGISSTPGTVIPNALQRVIAADIDADGVDDLVTRLGTAIEIRFAQGDRTFSAPTQFECPAGIRRLAVGDFNEDCVPDLVAALGDGLCALVSVRQ